MCLLNPVLSRTLLPHTDVQNLKWRTEQKENAKIPQACYNSFSDEEAHSHPSLHPVSFISPAQMDLAEQWPKHYKVTSYKNLENWKCSSKLTYLDREFCYIGHFLRDANLTFNCVLLHRCKQNNNKNSPSAQT